MLHGKKIILRPFRAEDADALWHSLGNELFNKLTGTHGSFTREMIDNYVAQQPTYDPKERAAFVMALPDDSRAVGEVVINEVDPDNHSANIRISLFDETDLGKGYGTEAMRLMVAYGFREMDLHRISLGVYDFNPRAVHVYEKIGFVREGVFRDALYWDGEYVNEIRMSILKHEWENQS